MASIKVARKKNESSDQLLTRFNRRSTRFVKDLRTSRYRPDRLSPLKKRTKAVIREGHRAAAAKRKNYE
ncbi:MAG: hypothetical protein V2A63_00610 [Patescibacteria group bacterium]